MPDDKVNATGVKLKACGSNVAAQVILCGLLVPIKHLMPFDEVYGTFVKLKAWGPNAARQVIFVWQVIKSMLSYIDLKLLQQQYIL